MSRLYYEPIAVALKQRRRSGNEYLEKVAKLIPGEIVAAYIALTGLVPSVELIPQSSHFWVYIGIFIGCLVLTPLYLLFQAEAGKPNISHVVVSTVAFVVWAYSVSGNVVWPEIHDAALASIVLVVFSLISGLIPLESE